MRAFLEDNLEKQYGESEHSFSFIEENDLV